ncbi:MAG: hypothetical protein ACR2QW_14305 [bacterium]
MAVTRKPKAQKEKSVDVEALIQKGGSVAVKSTVNKSRITPVALRVPSDLIERLDRILLNKPVKVPRHTWILEAIVEKLEREPN